MADLDAILQLLQKVAADNEAFRLEAARQRERDQREIAKQRLLDREYLDQRLFSLETSFNKSLSDVSAAIGASASISTQSSNVSKRSRESFECHANAVLRDPDEVVGNWFNGQHLWETDFGVEVIGDQPGWSAIDPAARFVERPEWGADALLSDPPHPGTLQHSQQLTPAEAHPNMDLSAVLKVLPSDNPKQCLLCGFPFKYKRFSDLNALTYLLP